jgi:pimeloyl-ACP methyl ester carboxylesterase
MTPIVFGGRFGWLHVGQGSHGVVLCNPFGHEEAWGHKAMRYLAEELSRRDIPVLRFDYLATGDSVGIDHESDRLDDFVADIGAAIERLRHDAGVTKVTLCGLRLGGTLAALASQHPLVDSLALLAPVINGRHYLRELTALRKTWVENLPMDVRAGQIDSPFHVLGQVYSEAFRSRLGTLDLGKSISRHRAMPKRVFVADLRPGASQSLCTALRDRGVEVQAEGFDDYFEFMQETASSTLPEKTLKRTAQWIAQSMAEDELGDSMPDRMRKASRPSMSDDAIIETPEAIERPVIFGAAGLFGILCEPRDRLAGGPVIVITNTAGSVHQGDSRLSVRIAREMAQRGIASLRFDARGIGDSPARSPDGTLDTTASIHAESTIEDVATAGAWLKRKGYDNVVAFGICSGAYSALRASLVEPAIAAVIAVNLQRFYIPERLTLQELRNQRRNTMARLGPAILKPKKWWLVLSGQRRLKPIVKAFASNAAARLQSQMLGVTRKKEVHTGGNHSLTDPHSVVHALERKGVRTLLVYGAGDEGLDQLNAHFGRHGKKLSRTTRVRVAVCSDVDHALYDTRALASVIALADTFIKDLKPDSAPVMEPVAPLGVSPQV